jgi:hypothetical protein
MNTIGNVNIPIELFEKIYFTDHHTLKKEYKFLGQGASRIVYAINEDYVVKLSKNRTGKYQCRTEYYIYNNIEEEYKIYFCPIVWYKEGMIVMRRAEPFSEILGLKHGSIFEYTSIKRSSEFFRTIKKIATRYDLLYPDIKAISSWGIFEKKPVLIDYGCTNSLYDKYFD